MISAILQATPSLVCCGLDEDGQVVICNPASGRFKISRGSFAVFYAGIALTNGEMGDLE